MSEPGRTPADDSRAFAEAFKRRLARAKPNGDNLDENVLLRVSPAEKLAWHEFARQNDTTVSQLIRDTVNAKLRRSRERARPAART